MTLGEMRRILAAGDIQLTRSLGQNFLHDARQLDRIVAAAQLGPDSRVLEIGPGLGPLTERLLSVASEVLAIEKDARLAEVLRGRFGADGRLHLVVTDAMDWLRENPRDWSDWSLVANLPYSVASPLLVDLAGADGPPARMVVTLQLEVVRRIAAQRDTSDYGLLTLLLGLRYEVGGWFGIPRGCFFPAPDVDSACVTLVRRAVPLADRRVAAVFIRVVKRGFSQRRKMMLKLLKQDWPAEALAVAFEAAGITPTERAEKVGLEQFVTLARSLAGPPPG